MSQATVISRLDAAFCISLTDFVFPIRLISVCLHTPKRERETLENADHVSPRIWEITKDNTEEEATK